MFGWDFEDDAWSRFWRWNLIKICVWTWDKNSTLGSVVPLAMFTLSALFGLFVPTWWYWRAGRERWRPIQRSGWRSDGPARETLEASMNSMLTGCHHNSDESSLMTSGEHRVGLVLQLLDLNLDVTSRSKWVGEPDYCILTLHHHCPPAFPRSGSFSCLVSRYEARAGL